MAAKIALTTNSDNDVQSYVLAACFAVMPCPYCFVTIPSASLIALLPPHCSSAYPRCRLHSNILSEVSGIKQDVASGLAGITCNIVVSVFRYSTW